MENTQATAESSMEANPTTQTNTSSSGGDKVKFQLNYKKQNTDIEFSLDSTLGELRAHVFSISGVAPGLQKLMYKGMLKEDSKTLRELGIKDGIKIMLVGSSIGDVMNASAAPPTAEIQKAEEQSTESLSEKLPHKKIIEKGIPEGVEPAKKGKHEALPQTPIGGVLNNLGTKVRLTFKVWSQELWIQSATSTQKIPFQTIRTVQSEPIKGHEDYHIVSLQVGSSDKNKYYLYWVPCQYTRAIKTAIMSDFPM